MDNEPSKKIIIAQILVIFLSPVALLYFGILPYNFRFILLTISALFIYGIIEHEHWTHKEMGLRMDNFKEAFPFYLVFTILGICALLFVDHAVNLPDIDSRISLIRSWAFFIPISFFQEFGFRSFLVPRLKEIFKNNYIAIIFINTVLFTLIHVIYPNLGIGLPVAFVAGIFFTWLYLKYPNLLLITISHSILNIIAVLLGFFGPH